MNIEDVILLLQKYEDGLASSEERAMLESWYNKKASEQGGYQVPDNFLHLKNDSLEKIISKPIKKKAIIGRLSLVRYVAAACILLIVTIGVVIYRKTTYDKFANVNIQPGKNQAILTLSNGKKIQLEDALKGELAQQAGITIVKNAEGHLIYKISDVNENSEVSYNIIQTPKAGQQTILLQDGTKVMLNASSSIRFPSTFSKLNKRVIELTGEAYFEVTKNLNQPFVVVSNHQHLQVLGTHFNVNSYGDGEHTVTTLVEGAVKIFPNNTKLKDMLMSAGQQTEVNEADVSVKDTDVEEAVAWKDGYFKFNNASIETVMKKLERWYDIDVQYVYPLSKQGINGTISRFSNISDVLRMLEKTKVVNFKVEGRRVIVTQ